MPSRREVRRAKARSEKRASKARGMKNPGGASRYALKKDGTITPEYRREGAMLLNEDYLRVLEMPGPHIVTLREASL